MTFDLLLKKYFLGVVLAFVALAAYFQASGATQLIGAAFSGPAASAAPPRVAAAPAPTAQQRPDAEAIIARNPFDSVTGPLNATPVPPADVPVPGKSPVDDTDPLIAPVCDSPTVYIVTESNDPKWSVAALQAPGDPRPRMHRVGDDVGGKKVEFIGYNPRENTPAVWLSSGTTLCQAMLFKTQPTLPAAAPTAAAAPTPPPPPASGGPSAVPADIASKIQKVSDTEFNIDRSVVDKILENQAELMKSARIVPETKDGKVLGIRLFGIRPETLLGTLGLQNGDRLESINGFNMGSPEKALEAYARLRTASQLDVTVNRRGAPVSIVHHIK
ncbi:MAG TPA: type II secretion system protein GspC [Polyangiaceae bacterium]|nr:type II secretion system protein GspC [Polyangiaceae bacterium]